MKYCVIGLGVFGRSLCKYLSSLGAEVLAIDNREDNVAAVKDLVSVAISMDYTDPTPFEHYAIREMDAVIVALGNNFEASMVLVMRMQELGVKRIVARVLSPMHERLLKILKVDRLIVPEVFAARGLAHSLMMRGVVDGYDLGDNHVIIEARVPVALVGKTLRDFAEKFKKHSILLVTIKRLAPNSIVGKLLREGEDSAQDGERHTLGTPTLDSQFNETDILVLFGSQKKLSKFLDENSTISSKPEKK